MAKTLVKNLETLPKPTLKVPEKFEAYSMVQLPDRRYAVIRTTITNEKITGIEILSTEAEKQFAQERFKIITYQEGMCDR